MSQECLNVCTRAIFRDYSWKGDCGENFYEVMRANPDWKGITDLLHTVKPTVLILENNLYVTAIPTRRKDKVGTPIRWNFQMRRPDAVSWFAPLVDAFKNGMALKLGDELDRICDVNSQNDSFSVPVMTDFLAILPPPVDAEPIPFKLWMAFVPTDKAEIQNMVDELAIPEGEIIIHDDGEDTAYYKKKAPASDLSKISAGKRALLLACAILLAGVALFLIV